MTFDKDKKRSDITILINGKEHDMVDWVNSETAATQSEKTLNWRESFKEDQDAYKGKEKEPFATSHEFNQHYQLNKKKRKSLTKRKKVYNGYAHKKKNIMNSPSISIHSWIPIFAAVIVGLGLGFSLLLYFSSQQDASKKALEAQTVNGTPNSNEAQAASKTYDLNQELYVIQAGVFSDSAQANKKIKQLNRKKVSAAPFENNRQYSVMIQMSTNQKQNDQLAKLYKKKHISIYTKSFTIKNNNSTLLKSNSVASFMYSGKGLVQQLMSVIQTMRLSGGKTDVSQKVKKITVSKVKWELPSSAKLKTMSSQNQQDIKSFYNNLTNAIIQVNALKDDWNDQRGYQCEQNIIQALSKYERILNES
ncbi:SPOR domain-containing protein [Terrilactibacillus laevilacticus]|uniref:SPOR domain-containing protein n=1 Tax=Terrilactibacillus laevilacticus TaxID=1380157 RepID=A0ABW5PU58_9BACI|nr:SPOR domain-containing protein [Terrilactibacillus laevilacticus]